MFSKPPFEMSRESYESLENASQNIIITVSLASKIVTKTSDEAFL